MQPVPQDLLKEYVQNQHFTSTTEIMEAMKEMFRDVIQTVMKVEMDEELGRERCERSDEPEGSPRNYRNGYTKKTVKTQLGEVDIKVPRDRNGSFEPKIIGKYDRNADGMEDKILALYACGMSQRDIAEQIKELYGVEISPELVTKISEKIMPEVTAWQNRPLEPVYPFVFMDAIHYKVREDRRYVTKAAYVVLGVTMDGRKDILGVWIGEHENSKFWLNDLKSRGVLDVYLFCTDGLCGMMQAIEAVFPKSRLQRCIVHQVRSSTRYVSYKDIKKVVADLKKIYSAVTLEEAEKNLQVFAETWRKQYPLLCEKLGGKLAGFKHVLRIPRGDSENHIHDEHHRGPEPPVPADYEEQAFLHERRLPAPDAVSGLPAPRVNPQPPSNGNEFRRAGTP